MVDTTVDVLVARDNQNFLKNEKCTTREMSLASVYSTIFREKIEDVVDDEKLYFRFYLDEHKHILESMDFSVLNSFATANKDNGENVYSNDANNIPFKPKNIGIWTSSEGCVTPLHFDICHGFLVQVYGRKNFILCSPDDTPFVYWDRESGSRNVTTSAVDLTKWIAGDLSERSKYPLIEDVAWYVADLSPNDTVYTPPGGR